MNTKIGNMSRINTNSQMEVNKARSIDIDKVRMACHRPFGD